MKKAVFRGGLLHKGYLCRILTVAVFQVAEQIVVPQARKGESSVNDLEKGTIHDQKNRHYRGERA